MDHKILNGDAKEVLQSLPDKSVNCVVTSPPYYALRDYGTAQWEGGSEDCDHRTGRDTRGGFTDKQKSNTDSISDESVKTGEHCPKCGAKRIDDQLGLEKTPEEYVERIADIFDEIWRVLRKDGTVWLNLGSSYNGSQKGYKGNNEWADVSGSKQETNKGSQNLPPTDIKNLKPKDLIPIPWLVGLELQRRGWFLRADIIWQKNNAMCSSVEDRVTISHEYVLMLSKSRKYFYDNEAIKEPHKTSTLKRWNKGGENTHNTKYRKNVPDTGVGNLRNGSNPLSEGGRNKRSVWNINTKGYSKAHFATYSPELVRPCILAGCPDKCCPECRKPWKRIKKNKGHSEHGNYRKRADAPGAEVSSSSVFRTGKIQIRETTGWEPDCNCDTDKEPVAGTVLDPFAGSGTTAQVAEEEGRNSIMIELNESYNEFINERIQWGKEERERREKEKEKQENVQSDITDL